MIVKNIPNPDGPKVEVGDKVKITEGELIGYVGEIVSFVQSGSQWIKTIKTINADGVVQYVEVKTVALELAGILEAIGKSKVFKKFWGWFTNLFRKKENKRAY